MSNEKAAFLTGTERRAWPWAIAIVVAALATVGATGAHAEMGENDDTNFVTITEGDTITRFCELGNACSDEGAEGALSGPFEGIWREEPFVEPGDRSFLNIRLEKVLSTPDFDVYCAAGDGVEGCAKIESTGDDTEPGECGLAPQALKVVSDPGTCAAGFDYKLEYDKTSTVSLTVCSGSNAVASCIDPGDPLVEGATITDLRAGFDYDCVRYCRGGCCR